MYFKSCLRLAKMFKLHNLLEQFNKKLYVLNLNESPEVSQVAQVAADTTETSNEIKLNQFNIDEKLNEGQVTINDTDIFRKFIIYLNINLHFYLDFLSNKKNLNIYLFLLLN